MSKIRNKKLEDLTGFAACVIVCRDIIAKSVSSKCYLQYLASNVHDESCTFFKSTQDIAADTGLSEHTIRDLNEKWEKAGFLNVTVYPWWTGKANDYTLNISALRKTLKAQEESGYRDAKKLKARSQGRERTRRCRAKKAAEKAQMAVVEASQTADA